MRSADRNDRWDASWESAARTRLDATLRATPAQRLAWLEQAIELAYRSGALELSAKRHAEAEGSKLRSE